MDIERERTRGDLWWHPQSGFFGKNYMRGDASLDGYLRSHMETLPNRTDREVEGILRLTNIHSGDRVVDVPCGYGRHAIALSARGIRCLGVDLNPEHLACARQAAHGDMPVQFLEADMRSFAQQAGCEFDAVINMFFSFGFFSEEQDNEATARQFYTALKPGGRCLIHTDVAPEMIAAGMYRTHEIRRLSGGKLIIDEKFDAVSRRLCGTWKIESEGGRDELPPYSVRLYSAPEFEELLTRVGFREVRCYGSFAGDPYTPRSEELIVVARK